MGALTSEKLWLAHLSRSLPAGRGSQYQARSNGCPISQAKSVKCGSFLEMSLMEIFLPERPCFKTRLNMMHNLEWYGRYAVFHQLCFVNAT